MTRRSFLLGLPGLAGCARDRRPRLNVFNWSGYVAPETIPEFEREFGVRVRYSTYESNEELLAKVMSGNSGWDVVFPTSYYIGPMRQFGLLAPLEPRWLSNLDQLDARYRAPSWDPKLAWSVPYIWGATGIAYNRRLVPPLSRWADLWDERLRGRLTMLDDPAEVLGACLLKLGHPLNSTDPDELRRAQREAITQKRLLRAYLNTEVRDQLVAGDVLAAQLWATTAQQAMDASPDLGFVYPAEGFALWADNAVVLRESRRRELAHRFIDYLLRPRVAARIAEATRTATVNAGARALLREALRNNPVLYPPPEVLARGQWFEPMPAAAQRLRDRLWTEIKSA
ncbi:MAG: spermidine/putrescine ABC transporter substrate-binding protein [Acidobacteriota bacterium]